MPFSWSVVDYFWFSGSTDILYLRFVLPVAYSREILVLPRPSVYPQTVLADEDWKNLRTETFFTVHRVLGLRDAFQLILSSRLDLLRLQFQNAQDYFNV